MTNLRDAYRSARSTPVVSGLAILSIGLGIGATTAIFSITNSLLLKPLPVRAANELVVVDSVGPGEWYGVGYPIWREIRDRKVFRQAFAWGTDRVALSDRGEIKFAEAIWTSGNAFDVLGVGARLGRTFSARDDHPGGGPAGPVAVISDGFWRRNFAGAPDVVGQSLVIERIPYTIVGIMPADFYGLTVGGTFDVMLPLETEPLLGRIPKRLESPLWTWLYIMGRRTGNETPESLTAALNTAQPDIRLATLPTRLTRAEDRERYLSTGWQVRSAPGGLSRVRRLYGPAVLTLLSIVGIVLLIACANVATLLLARSRARTAEFSVRRALGASSAQLVRQLLAESLLLSGIGAVMGVLLATWSTPLLVTELSTWASTSFLDLSIDWRVLSVTVLTTVGTGLAFGTLPAYRGIRVPPVHALKGPRQDAGGGRAVGALVIAQIGLSLVLLVGATLFIRSFVALAYRDIGFDRNRVLVAVLDARRGSMPASARGPLYERIREAVVSVPGVESAALSLATPLGNAGIRFSPEIAIPDNSERSGKIVRTLTTPVSPEWLRTYGTRLLAGRDFREHDRPGAPEVAIVNEAFAQRYFHGGFPLGRTLLEVTNPADRRPVEIVGVVHDAAFASVRDRIEPTIYRPLAQKLDEKVLAALPSISISIRAVEGIAPSSLASGVASAITAVDPNLAVTFQAVSEQLRVFYIREKLLAVLAAFFGALALLLSAIGVYAVLSYSVTLRRSEIGIRMALGADRGRVMKLVLGNVAVLTAVGLTLGTIASVWLVGLVKALVYETQPRDPLTFAAAGSILVLVCAVAACVPAWRAARTAPAVVLRRL